MEFSTDVLIIGTGVAGMYSALNLRKDLNITIIAAKKADKCSTYYAQGGIATAKDDDDIEPFIEDTLKAGKYKNKLQSVQILAKQSRKNIEELKEFGLEFDRDEKGFQYTREAAHRKNRIVHCKDITGKKVFETLFKNLEQRTNITLFEDTVLVDLISKKNRCTGAIFLNKDNVMNISAKEVILATGGIGGLFKNSTNEPHVKGIGLAMAKRNNIKLEDVKYIQFHPTGLYEQSAGKRRFLISESLRGEGAKIVNKKGKRFVDELLPRDIVANAVREEEKDTKANCVYLDISHMDKEFVKSRFPGIYKGCMERGVDITKGKIPVTPVQHYFMGGIKVNTNSQTSMKNLFACGEASCTGVHGANRLASNSLLEALVFSKRAAEFINEYIERESLIKEKVNITSSEAKKTINENEKIALEELMLVREDIKSELANC